MSAAAGQNLDWYFRQALLQPGYPILRIDWKHEGQKLTFDITQTQPSGWGTYRIPNLILRVDGKPVRLEVSGRRSRTSVEGFRKKPKKIDVDPSRSWLLKSTVTGER
jgi:aminopeptidase N